MYDSFINVAGVSTVTMDMRQVLGPDGPIAKSLPGYEAREPQLQISQLFAECIQEKVHGVVEAGTGTGKSFAYLVPAITSGKRTVVSTANIALQDQLIDSDVPFLQEHLKPFTAAKVTGLSNYVCKSKLADLREQSKQGTLDFEGSPQGAAEAFKVWPTFAEWVQTTPDGDIQRLPYTLPMALKQDVVTSNDECLGSTCKYNKECFGLNAKRRAKTAQVVIVNHWLLILDLMVRSESNGSRSVIPGAVDIVVVDEAHRLAEVARDMLGIEVTSGRMEYLNRKISKLVAKSNDKDRADEWTAMLQGWTSSLFAYFRRIEMRMREIEARELVIGDDSLAAGVIAQEILAFAARMTDGAPSGLDGDAATSWERMAELATKLAEDLLKTATPNPEMVRWSELVGREGSERVKLLAKPVSPAKQLRRMLFEARLGEIPDDEEDEIDVSKIAAPELTVLSTSATIATDGGMSYWKGEVGCDDAYESVVDSPFNYRRNALTYLPADAEAFDSSKFRGELTDQYVERLAKRTEDLLLASRGRALCLYTSRRMMTAVYERLSPRLQGMTVLVQDEMPKRELIRVFKEGNAVLFATKSFWEGIDIKGDALSIVIIDKLPFWVPGAPMNEARKRKINDEHRDRWAWFDRLQIPETIIEMKQAYGRLVRTSTDTGVVAILDGRLRSKPYGPRILRSLPPATVTTSLDAVRAHFEIR